MLIINSLSFLKHLNNEGLNFVDSLYCNNFLSELCTDTYFLKLVESKISEYGIIDSGISLNINLSSTDGLRSAVRKFSTKNLDNYLFLILSNLNNISVYGEMKLEKIDFFVKEEDNNLLLKLVFFSPKLNQCIYGELTFL